MRAMNEKLRSRLVWLVLLMAGLLMGAAWGCSASDGNNGTGTGTGTGNNTGGDISSGSGGSGGCVFCNEGGFGGVGPGTLIVTPADVTIDISGGTIPTQQFTAEYNGQDVTGAVTWVFEKPSVGDVSGQGMFIPTGNVGGLGQLIALYNSDQATANITVNISKIVNTANLPQNEQDELANPQGGPDPSLSVLYPYDNTVMPLRVLSPEIQWSGGAAGDTYRLRMTSAHMDYVEFITANPPSMHTLSQEQWENIQFSGSGPFSDPLVVELTRKSGGVVYQPATFNIRIAQDFVHGSVYYWQLPDACGSGNGKILRISPNSTQSDEFFPTGECWGCHTVSRDGTEMMGSWSNGAFPFPLQTLNLTQSPAVFSNIVQAVGLGGTFSAYNNDSNRIIYSDNGTISAPSARLHIVDAQTGQFTLQNAMGPGCGEPAWSPAGTKLAAICGMTTGGWTFDATNGELAVADVDPAGTTVSGQVTIVPQGGLAGRPAYPSFSPDSQFIAYGRPTSGSRTTGNGTLWLTDVSGQNVVELSNASNDNKSFNPVFAPKAAGGFTWVVFISRRNYGHQLVNANRQQLWVTAITDPPSFDADPSHPPFYLRGQQMCGKSENAYYALDPCKADGESCEHGIECCNKSCIYDDQAGTHICKEPEPGECIPTGSGVCTADDDCCDYTGPSGNVTCVNGFCELKPPQ